MQATINGVRYNTDNCHELAKFGRYAPGGAFEGTVRLMEAGDDNLLVWLDVPALNSQRELLVSWDTWKSDKTNAIDQFTDIVDEDRLIARGMLKIAPANANASDEARHRSKAVEYVLKTKEIGKALDEVSEALKAVEDKVTLVRCLMTYTRLESEDVLHPVSYDEVQNKASDGE